MSTTFSPVRIVVVGVGGFGRLHARTIEGIAEAELAGVVDARPESLAELKMTLPDVKVWPTVGDAIEKSGAEAFVIATRTDSHVTLAEQVLRAGRIALVEKPLGKTANDAERLSELVRPDSSNLMVGHIVLFGTQMRQVLREANTRGPIQFFQAARHRPVTTGQYYPEENPIRMTMVHDLYVALALMNGAEPSSFSAWLHQRREGGFDAATAELIWPGGACGSFAASFLTPPGMPGDGFDRMEIFGEGWAARIALNPQPLELWTDKATWPIALDIHDDPASPSGWLAEELRHFCRVVRGQASVPLGARYQDALQVQRWIETLEQLARRRINHAG
jgi:predicted dehydrogenase